MIIKNEIGFTDLIFYFNFYFNISKLEKKIRNSQFKVILVKKTSLFEYLTFAIISLIIVWLSKDYFFFWDTVQLTSKHAHWYFEQGFSTFFLPQQFDSGHPPFWGMYHALLWNFFGKKLFVSHFAVFPFVFGSFIFANKIGKLLCPDVNVNLYFGLFLLADSVFLTQSIIVSPDIALCFFFLMSLYGIMTKPNINWFLILGGIGLSMISLRGMMTLAGLGLFAVLDHGFRRNFKQIVSFLPGILMGFGFLIAHSLHTKWVGYHDDSPWADSFKMVDISGVFKNIIILVWRFLDYGRIFLFIGILYFIIKLKSNNLHLNLFLKLFFALSVFLLPSFVLYKGLNAMRYLMPLLLIVNFLFLYLLFEYKKRNKKVFMSIFWSVFILFFLGNIWMYPKNISMSWDTTLQHIPYYSLRTKMINYIQQSNIPMHKIATGFPNMASLEIIDLNGINNHMISINDENTEYYFVSNVMNDVKNELQDIRNECTLVKRFEKGFLFVELYKK